MFLQNNKELNKDIQKIGCLYLSILRMVELVSNYIFTVNEVNDIWIKSKKLKYIDNTNRMIEPDKMLRMIKNDFGFSEFIFSIGLEENKKTIYWQWVSNSKNKIESKYKIEMRKTNGTVGTHFVLADANNNLLFDSYSFKNYDYKPSGRYHLYSYWS